MQFWDKLQCFQCRNHYCKAWSHPASSTLHCTSFLLLKGHDTCKFNPFNRWCIHCSSYYYIDSRYFHNIACILGPLTATGYVRDTVQLNQSQLHHHPYHIWLSRDVLSTKDILELVRYRFKDYSVRICDLQNKTMCHLSEVQGRKRRKKTPTQKIKW